MGTIHTEATEVRKITIPLALAIRAVGLNPDEWHDVGGEETATFTVQSVTPVVTEADV